MLNLRFFTRLCTRTLLQAENFPGCSVCLMACAKFGFSARTQTSEEQLLFLLAALGMLGKPSILLPKLRLLQQLLLLQLLLQLQQPLQFLLPGSLGSRRC